jgi:hypothetical protein
MIFVERDVSQGRNYRVVTTDCTLKHSGKKLKSGQYQVYRH